MTVTPPPYCFTTGTRSSRKIMPRCRTDVACRIIVGEDVPDFRTISDFREHRPGSSGGPLRRVLTCAPPGRNRLGNIAFGGTKIKANASRHKR